MKTNLYSSFYILPSAFLLACALSIPLRAATLFVTSTADSGPGTLRDALAGAGNGDRVDATGLSGAITLTSGQLNVTTNVTIVGPGFGQLTVDGNNRFRVFNVTGAYVTISGLTIANGYTLDNGGGIYNNFGVWLTVNHCVLIANSATNGYGGGCHNEGTLTISDSTFANSAAWDGGGCSNEGTLTISDSTFSGNSALFAVGGGCCNHFGTLTISDSTFSGNSASTMGGGCHNDDYATLTISDSTFSGNSASWGGGCCNFGTLTISTSTFNANSSVPSEYLSGKGGGIYNEGQQAAAMVTINLSTLSSNTASDSGGGLYNSSGGGSAMATVNASTFSSNSTSGGGGGCIFNDGSMGGAAILQIGDTILNGGAAAAGNLFNTSGTVVSAGYNLSSDSAGGFLTSATDILNANPLLAPLQYNGGPTYTCALLPGSPAIDRGKRDALPALASNTDQRGYARPVDLPGYPNATGGDGSDIGAYEVQPPISVISLNDTGPGTLRAALAGSANGDIIDARSLAGTITLTSGELEVPNCVSILGPGAGNLTVSGNHASRVFNVTGPYVTLSGLTIANGYANANGVGIQASGAGNSLTVANCVVSNNIGSPSGYSYGGGIFNNPGVTLTVSNSLICSNSAHDGGGLFNQGTLAVSASTVSGNSAYWGGALGNATAGASASISASTVCSNSASYGGGGFDNYSSGVLTISTSTFSGNSGAGNGGGGFNESDAGGLQINASTFSANTGGGIKNASSLEIGDTLFSTNGPGGNITNSGVVTTYGYNLSSDSAGGCLASPTDILNKNPMLGPLQDNGGPTWTCALLPGSPAIDKGKANAIPGFGLSTDQRGYPRPVDLPGYPSATGGDASDIGAYEFQRLPLFVSQSGPTVTVYWQNQPGWRLQQNASVAAPAGWTSNTAWTTANGTNYLNLNSPTGRLFFRLTQP